MGKLVGEGLAAGLEVGYLGFTFGIDSLEEVGCLFEGFFGVFYLHHEFEEGVFALGLVVGEGGALFLVGFEFPGVGDGAVVEACVYFGDSALDVLDVAFGLAPGSGERFDAGGDGVALSPGGVAPGVVGEPGADVGQSLITLLDFPIQKLEVIELFDG